MKKGFENYEIWWVTGAQLLYGGDAVVAVDSHSKEMVAGLNDSGNIPVKIVYKGTANSSKEVEQVMLAANGCTLSHLLRCGSRVCSSCRSPSATSIHSTTPKFPGATSTWTS